MGKWTIENPYEGKCDGCRRIKRTKDDTAWYCPYTRMESLPLPKDRFPWAMCADGRIEKSCQ